MLMARIFEVLPLLCPVCHGPLKIISFIHDPLVIDRILSHLDMETRPPPIHPARGPPDPNKRLGTPKYRSYMAKLRKQYPNVFVDRHLKVPAFPENVSRIQKEPHLAAFTYLRTEC